MARNWSTVDDGRLHAGSPHGGLDRPPIGNLAPNPSFESVYGARPLGWLQVGIGDNGRTFSAPQGVAQSGRRFIRVVISQYISGEAGWGLAPVAAAPGATYGYLDYRRTNAASALELTMVMKDGTVQRRRFATAATAQAWTLGGINFMLPAGVTRMSLARVLLGRGYLDVDATQLTLRKPAGVVVPLGPSKPPMTPVPVPVPSVTPISTPTPSPVPAPTPVPSSRALVSVTFDDGWQNQFTNAAPLLAKYHVPGTFYLVSSWLGRTGTMTVQQARQLQAAGNELGSHTVDHQPLTTLDPAAWHDEIVRSKAQLEALFGPIRSFAYPYGDYNSAIMADVATTYQTARTTDGGINQRASLQRSRLVMRYVTATTTTAEVSSWMRQAATEGGWTVLVLHAVGYGGDSYAVTPEQLDSELKVIADSGIPTRTISQAYAEFS